MFEITVRKGELFLFKTQRFLTRERCDECANALRAAFKGTDMRLEVYRYTEECDRIL